MKAALYAAVNVRAAAREAALLLREEQRMMGDRLSTAVCMCADCGAGLSRRCYLQLCLHICAVTLFAGRVVLLY
jgi:hypothetical protein